MSVTFSIPPADLRKFNDALRRRAETSKADSRDTVNKSALKLAHEALRQIPKADVERMKISLGQVGSTLGTTKSGKISRNRKKATILLSDDLKNSFAARIINSARKKSGKPFLQGEELRKAAVHLIQFRTTFVNFLKSGMIAAIRKLSPVVRGGAERGNTSGVKIRNQPKGSATVAPKGTAYPVASITNSAARSEDAKKIVVAGIVKAIPIIVADMEVQTKKRVAESNLKAFGR